MILKRIVPGVFAIALVSVSLIYLSSCAIKQGPVSPNSNLVSSTDSRSAELPKVFSFTPGAVSLTGEIRVVFDKKMNPTTLNAGTVLLYYKNGSDTSELQYTEFSLTYLDATKTLVIRPTNLAGWRDNTRFRIQLMHGIMSAAGAPLDGNANDINDGNVLDDYHNQFYTGAPPAGESSYSLSNLAITNVWVDAANINSIGDLAAGNVSNVPAMYTYVTITAQFSTALDTNTVFIDSSQLHPNFGVANTATGVTPPIITIETIGNSLVSGVFRLDPASIYMLSILGGITGARSSSDATEALNRGKYFQGNNSIVEAADKVEAYLSTAAADNTAITYPDISGYEWQPGDRRFRITFPISTPMDKTTLTNANLLMVGRYPQTGEGQVYNIVPKFIDISTSGNVVYIYLPDRFYPANYQSAPLVNVKVIVKRYVKSETGQYLDNNNDGIVLTDDDDYVPAWVNDVPSGI